LNKKRALLFIVIAGALIGCDAVEREEAALTEKLLADAGFQNFAADDVPSDQLAGIRHARWPREAKAARLSTCTPTSRIATACTWAVPMRMPDTRNR
jgi:hypothetical protein